MQMSAILNFRVKEAIAYTYSVEDPRAFIYNQGLEVLRSVSSRFVYRSSKEPSLMSDGKLIEKANGKPLKF